MATSIIRAGGTGVAGVQTTGGDDGALALKVGPLDATVEALNISAAGTGAFVGQVTATGFTGTLDGILGSGTAAAATTTTLASTTITASGIVKTDDTTAATSTTDGSLQTDGGLSVVLDAVIGDDLFMLSDAAVVTFGADKDVTLTHVADTGLLLNAAMVVQFRDSAINIGSPADGDLDINADDEIELNSTLIDINGNLDVSGTGVIAGAVTTAALTASGIIKTDDTTAATSTTDGSLQTDGGLSVVLDAVIGDDIIMLSDGAQIAFGTNSEITATHVHNVGLNLKHTATADDKPIILTLQTGETDMAANDVMGKIAFQAPDEGTGTDAVLVAAAIQARAEGDFSSSSNATSIDFMTGASEAAATKMTLTSAGRLGIGTAAPATNLHIVGVDNNTQGQLTVQSTGNDARIEFRNSVAAGSGGSAGIIASGSSGYEGLRFMINGYDKVIIDESGKVGIGTVAPASKLVVDGTINITDTDGTYAAGALGYTDANHGFLYRPPQAGGSSAHLFEAFDGTDLVQIQESGTVSYGVSPGANYTADVVPGAITVANNGTVNFPSFSGYLLICSHTTGHTGIYIAGGGSTSEVGTIGGGGINGSFAGNATIGGYTYTNTYGAPQTLGFYSVRGRNTR